MRPHKFSSMSELRLHRSALLQTPPRQGCRIWSADSTQQQEAMSLLRRLASLPARDPRLTHSPFGCARRPACPSSQVADRIETGLPATIGYMKAAVRGPGGANERQLKAHCAEQTGNLRRGSTPRFGRSGPEGDPVSPRAITGRPRRRSTSGTLVCQASALPHFTTRPCPRSLIARGSALRLDVDKDFKARSLPTSPQADVDNRIRRAPLLLGELHLPSIKECRAGVLNSSCVHLRPNMSLTSAFTRQQSAGSVLDRAF